MRCLKKMQVLTAMVFVLAAGVSSSHAQNLLVNGDFEAAATIPGWMLEQTVTGMPGVSVNSALQQDFANQPMTIAGEFGLWLRPFVGNQGDFEGQNLRTNAILSQTVAGAANENYKLTGWSRFEPNYSGGVDFLDLASPSGEVPSPTESAFELTFLDASGAPLASPAPLDLRTVQFGDNMWRQHTVTGTAPAGTESIRVTASANDLIINIDPMQSGFYDNFSLTADSAPGTELLSNADLNEEPPEFPGYDVTELPAGVDNLQPADFANNPSTGGAIGAWVRSFIEGDAILSQTVDGVAGGDYSFSAFSAWEEFYAGGLPGTTTETFIELAFLDDQDTEIGDPERLDLLEAGQTNSPGPVNENPQAWRQFDVEGVAPAGTASVRVSVGAIGLVDNPEGSQSAFFDDLVLTLASAGLPGDYNQDGFVDAADYTVWRDNLGATITLPNEGATPGSVTTEDYDFWKSQFGATSASGNLLAGAGTIPEPTSCLLVSVALLTAVAIRRRASGPALHSLT